MLTRKSSIFISGLLFVSTFATLNYFFDHQSPTLMPSPSPTIAIIPASPIPVLGAVTKTTDCHAVDGLPDSLCTPGAIDPRVTQDNLEDTICKKGYTSTIRPPVSYTNKLKVAQIEAYGYINKNLRDYEEDHLIPLEVGGSPTDPANLWPELGDTPNPKDQVENLCNEKVCRGKIQLQDAQLQIARDWRTACQ